MVARQEAAARPVEGERPAYAADPLEHDRRQAEGVEFDELAQRHRLRHLELAPQLLRPARDRRVGQARRERVAGRRVEEQHRVRKDLAQHLLRLAHPVLDAREQAGRAHALGERVAEGDVRIDRRPFRDAHPAHEVVDAPEQLEVLAEDLHLVIAARQQRQDVGVQTQASGKGDRRHDHQQRRRHHATMVAAAEQQQAFQQLATDHDAAADRSFRSASVASNSRR